MEWRREDGCEIRLGDRSDVGMREENPSRRNGVGGVSPNKTGHLEGAEDFMSGTEEPSSRVKAQDM